MESVNAATPLKKKRIIPRRPNGLFNKNAPYWKGERAEDIVNARVKALKKPRKKRQ